MKLPKYGHEIVIARDRYNTAILIHGNEVGHDLSTNGRVLLTRTLAKQLAKKLLKYAESAT